MHDVQLAEEATHDDQESNEHLTGEIRGAEETQGARLGRPNPLARPTPGNPPPDATPVRPTSLPIN